MLQDLLFKVLGDKWLRLLVLLLVLAALAHQASLLFWHLYPQPQMAQAPQPDTLLPAQSAGKPAPNYQQQALAISRSFLFGKVEAGTVSMVQVEEAPETQLNYKLRGTYFSKESRLASAIVEVQPNKSKSYMLDDELAEKITLAAIREDHILINRYGKIERLNLVKELPEYENDNSIASRSADDGSGDSVALLRSYKKRYASNPMALATRFQAIPVQQDGQNIGFKLKALRGESLLQKLNFEENDVFTAVNGVSLASPFEALDALKSLTTADNVTVTIMRNGSEQTLDLRL